MKKIILTASFMNAIFCFAQKSDSLTLAIKNRINNISDKSNHKGSFRIAPTLGISTTTLNPSLGIVGYYSPYGKRDLFTASVNYFHSTSNVTEQLFAYNPNSYGKEINSVTKINSTLYQLGYLHYFNGDFSNKGIKFYMTAGMGLEVSSMKVVNRPDYDNSNYYLKAPVHSYHISPYAYFGAGIEKSVGSKGSVFAEISNNYNLGNYYIRNQVEPFPFPYYKSISLTMGYKIKF